MRSKRHLSLQAVISSSKSSIFFDDLLKFFKGHGSGGVFVQARRS